MRKSRACTSKWCTCYEIILKFTQYFNKLFSKRDLTNGTEVNCPLTDFYFSGVTWLDVGKPSDKYHRMFDVYWYCKGHVHYMASENEAGLPEFST